MEKVPTPPWERDGAKPVFAKEKVKQAARRIFEQIAEDKHSYGSRLDAERDLAEQLDVSRALIRQALDFLEEHEVVARKPNSGTFVIYKPPPSGLPPLDSPVEVLDIRSMVESASPFEMNVACSLLEPEIVRLATLYMSVRDLMHLKGLLEAIEKIVTDAEQFALLENEFFMTIAQATQNRLLITMYRIVFEVRRQQYWLSMRVQLLSPQRIRDSQQQLRSLYGALENRDIEGAVEFMKLIIASNQEALLYSP